MKQGLGTFTRYKWTGVIAFSLMYVFVYLGRFNMSYLMGRISEDVIISAGQQQLITISILFSYALGSFINGYLADLYGAKKIIVLGGIMTCVLNMCVAVINSWIPMLIIWFINGYFQSMIWVGGISMLSYWWKERERGKAVAVVNFFSGMSHAVAYLVPVVILSMWPALGWRSNFTIPISILLVLVIIFAVLAVEKPEDAGLDPYKSVMERHRNREETLLTMKEDGRRPWMYYFKQPKFLWWCGIAMISSICRYGLLNWIPMYFGDNGESVVLNENFSNLTLPIGMAVGTLIITWYAGTRMFDNKGIVVTAMAAICGALIIVFPMIDNTQAVMMGIFFTGFFLYGINGILWIHAIDQGCRVFSGSVAGIFNGFAYLGACLEGIVFPVFMNWFGNYLAVFILMEIFCILMVGFAIAASKKNSIVERDVRGI